ALEAASPDYCLPVDEISRTLVSLTGNTSDTLPETENGAAEVPLETVEEAASPSEAVGSAGGGGGPGLTRPHCPRPVWEIKTGDVVRYRCRVGHAYSSLTMLHAQGESVERALWAALRSLEEREALLGRLAHHATRRGHDAVARMFQQRAQDVNDDVKA